MKKYPNMKVIGFFSLSPLFGGWVIYVAMIFNGNLEKVTEGSLFYRVLVPVSLLSLNLISSLIVGIIPAFILGAICCAREMNRSFLNCIFVFFVGGIMSFICSGLMFNYFNENFISEGRFPYQVFTAKSLVIGSLCALLAYLFSIPDGDK